MGHTSETSLSFTARAKESGRALQSKRKSLHHGDLHGHLECFQQCRARVLPTYRKLVFSNLHDAMVRCAPTASDGRVNAPALPLTEAAFKCRRGRGHGHGS